MTKIKISTILMDEKTYPRMVVDWVTTAKYFKAVKAGVKFPAIIIGVFEEKPYLVDGAHRMTAFKQAGHTEIEAELLNMKSKRQIYIEAVKRNSTHGRSFSSQEVANIITNLKQDMTIEQIGVLVHMETDKVEPFAAKRMTLGTASNPSGIPLKSSLQGLAGTSQPDSLEINQKVLVGASQNILLDNFVTLLENEWIDLDDKVVRPKAQLIYDFLTAYGFEKSSKLKNGKGKSPKNKSTSLPAK